MLIRKRVAAWLLQWKCLMKRHVFADFLKEWYVEQAVTSVSRGKHCESTITSSLLGSGNQKARSGRTRAEPASVVASVRGLPGRLVLSRSVGI